MRREKRVQTARNWSALYQQRPAPLTGDYFKKDWLRPYTTIPDRKTLRIYGGSDYAVTSDGGDYTAHVVVGLDPEGRMYLLDVWRQQTSSDVWIEALVDLILKWTPTGKLSISDSRSAYHGAWEARGLGRGADPDHVWCRAVPDEATS